MNNKKKCVSGLTFNRHISCSPCFCFLSSFLLESKFPSEIHTLHFILNMSYYGSMFCSESNYTLSFNTMTF